MIPDYLHALFWDVNLDSFNPVSHPEYTIARVLELGDEEAVRWMEETFSREQIAAVLRNDRRLSRKSANFWALVYGIEHSDVAALTDEAGSAPWTLNR